MAEEIDDLSVNWDEGGTVTVEQLDKTILSRGSWVTILFKYREQNQKTQAWTAPKFTLRRYQKRNGVYRQQSKFNISSFAQAKSIVGALQNWITEAEAAGVGDDGGGGEE